MVLILLLLLCNHDNLILKLHQKNSYLDEGWLFIGSFKLGSVPGFYINLHNQLKNCLRKFGKIITLCSYIEGRGWINAQILLTNVQVYKVRFLICLFKSSSITYHLSSFLSNN